MRLSQLKAQQGNCKSTVAVVHCQNYDHGLVDLAIDQVARLVGGLDQFVAPGMQVHVKPNLLAAKPPERAATTHPSIVQAIVERIMRLGATVTIGDSPAGISRPIEEYWRITGMEQVAKQTGAQLVQLEKKGVIERRVNGRSYFIARAIAEADLVINICKLKTHNLTLYTGAIKNMFGSIPGFQKSEYHKQHPKVEQFAEIIVDVFQAVQPRLSIMDAVEMMEGNGPSAGTPRHLGLILASCDAVALDSVAARLIGFDHGEVLTTSYAYHRGLGEADLRRIELVGDPLPLIEPNSIELPANRLLHYVPGGVVKLLGKLVWVRPKPSIDRCKRCGACIKICPTQAMSSRDGFPIIDYKKCISCFCCDETCPHNAIDQDMSWLTKLFR
ncbi:MAG: DUF362 domain-containing protein [candidate division KSB1 bacterium]|nr:DUF362 domain-containing protein [candidate division KSB1 bacterium]MDZ7335604.1 DUF362 domain-containing protein [candidate division KSB1 bacterium]MDZ7357574.1 DUF362 domain-containing protein [candidate division KSB1 bacterium]MDZ7376870.1 DUF362 domain-containing protein [candidate division KSB1 bacterium]MDZ7399769.1 DUF362 domain-containing protein [candidate division KSB1 bacterium]